MGVGDTEVKKKGPILVKKKINWRYRELLYTCLVKDGSFERVQIGREVY